MTLTSPLNAGQLLKNDRIIVDGQECPIIEHPRRLVDNHPQLTVITVRLLIIWDGWIISRYFPVNQPIRRIVGGRSGGQI